MKDTKIFNINEIITIVMEDIKAEENQALYGIDDDWDYPKQISDKLDTLSENEFIEFMDIIKGIVEKVEHMKNGELNELNKCHEEIMYAAENVLSKYMYE